MEFPEIRGYLCQHIEISVEGSQGDASTATYLEIQLTMSWSKLVTPYMEMLGRAAPHLEMSGSIFGGPIDDKLVQVGISPCRDITELHRSVM